MPKKSQRKVGRPPKVNKRGPGRPKRRPQSASELRERTLRNIKAASDRKTEEALALIPPPPPLPSVEEVADEVNAITLKHKYTKEEMLELKEKVSILYETYVTQRVNEDYDINREQAILERQRLYSNPSEAHSPSTITEAEWNELHGRRPDGKLKPGPKPKRKKLFYELLPGERGLAEEPMPPVDIDAMEKENRSAVNRASPRRALRRAAVSQRQARFTHKHTTETLTKTSSHSGTEGRYKVLGNGDTRNQLNNISQLQYFLKKLAVNKSNWIARSFTNRKTNGTQ